MARTRSIKPEFWDDEKLASISRDARLTFVGMWTASDDYGVVKGNFAWLKNTIYPYEEIKLSIFKGWVEELIKLCRILPFDHNGEVFYFIVNFLKHQRIDHPSKARNPESPRNILETIPKGSRNNRFETETETITETETNKEAPDLKKSASKEKMKETQSNLGDINIHHQWQEHIKDIQMKRWRKVWMSESQVNLLINKDQKTGRYPLPGFGSYIVLASTLEIIPVDIKDMFGYLRSIANNADAICRYISESNKYESPDFVGEVMRGKQKQLEAADNSENNVRQNGIQVKKEKR